MAETLLDLNFKFERTGQKVDNSINPDFPRQDTVILHGTITGTDLTGLAVVGSLKLVPQDVIIAAKTVANQGVTIINVSDFIKKVTVLIAEPSDSEGLEPGQQFVFDVQVSTSGIPAIVRTVKGCFKITEDYTLTVPTPIP
jgi:hypothetical protein|nr:MAG: hypothetical protein [uncultured cyanophage]